MAAQRAGLTQALDLHPDNIVTEEKALIEGRSRLIGRTLLYKSSATGSKICDSYVSWLFAGVGAAHTLILANIDTTSKYISLSAMKASIGIFLAASAIVAIEKFLSIYIQHTAAENSDVQGFANETISTGFTPDFAAIRSEMDKATLGFTRLFNRLTRLVADEPRAITVAKASQIQYVVAGIAAVMLISSIAATFFGLKV